MILYMFFVATLACSSFHEPTSVSDSWDGKKSDSGSLFLVSPPVSIKSTSSSNSKSGDPPPRPKKKGHRAQETTDSHFLNYHIFWSNMKEYQPIILPPYLIALFARSIEDLTTFNVSVIIAQPRQWLQVSLAIRVHWWETPAPPDYEHPNPSPDLTSGWNRMSPFGCHKWQNYSYHISVFRTINWNWFSNLQFSKHICFLVKVDPLYSVLGMARKHFKESLSAGRADQEVQIHSWCLCERTNVQRDVPPPTSARRWLTSEGGCRFPWGQNSKKEFFTTNCAVDLQHPKISNHNQQVRSNWLKPK